MLKPDLLIYPLHVVFWSAFGLTQTLTRKSVAAGPQDAGQNVAEQAVTAPFSRAVLAVHIVAFGVMYLGIASAVFGNGAHQWFPGQRIVGTAVIALGALVMCWGVAFFHSWRFRAKLEVGHQLATEGPFKLLRHPIYMGLNLLCLGTAIWFPTVIIGSSLALMVLGSDLRARSEESLLRRAFGSTYVDYCSRTRRFIPGLY